MEPTLASLCDLLARSRLMAPADVAVLRQRWQTEAGPARPAAAGAPDGGAFLRWLVARGYATEYQAGRLLKGHTDRFVLQGYKLLERIGAGRMAGVYKAIHKLGQVVAVKVLPPSKVKDAEAFGRFQREARLAVKLKHANVVRTFQVGHAEGLHFLVMEYLEGETLDEVLKVRRRLAPAEAVHVIHQALQGLHYLHDQDVVHRDLKPANLMLLPGGAAAVHSDVLHASVKILDVGVGRMLFDEEGAEGDVPLTVAGAMLGDPDYMAPEQARNAHGADIRADVYSLGCTLYHVLAGQVPFPDNNLVRKVMRHANETPRPLKTFNPEVPDGLQQVVDGMLAKDPARRYPTPALADRALEGFLASQASASPTAAGPTRVYLDWLEAQEQPVPAPPTVSVPAAVPIAMPARRRGIGRREVTFMLVGVAGAGVASVLGLLLLRWYRRKGTTSETKQP